MQGKKLHVRMSRPKTGSEPNDQGKQYDDRREREQSRSATETTIPPARRGFLVLNNRYIGSLVGLDGGLLSNGGRSRGGFGKDVLGFVEKRRLDGRRLPLRNLEWHGDYDYCEVERLVITDRALSLSESRTETADLEGDWSAAEAARGIMPRMLAIYPPDMALIS